jgi:hypothetical protein
MPLIVNALNFVTNKYSVTGTKNASIYIFTLEVPLLMCWSMGNKGFRNIVAIGSKFSFR